MEKKASEKVLQMETELMQARDDLVSLATTKDQEKQELTDALSKAQLEIEKANEKADGMKAQRVAETKENQEFVESLKKSAQEREDTMRQDLRRTKDLLTSNETELQNKICELKQSSDAKIEELSIQLELVLKEKEEIEESKAALVKKAAETQLEMETQTARMSELEEASKTTDSQVGELGKLCDHKEEIIESLSRELESLREEGETLKKREAVMVAENDSNCQVCSLRQFFCTFLPRKIITCTKGNL